MPWGEEKDGTEKEEEGMGEVAWLRGEEKDGTEKEEEGMGEVAWLRGEEKDGMKKKEFLLRTTNNNDGNQRCSMRSSRT